MCPYPTEGECFTPRHGATVQLIFAEDKSSRCVRCEAVVENVDAALDAIRVGQEALAKAASAQFRGSSSLEQD